jgi:hypothetical protein
MKNQIKVSELVFPEELVTRVKKNWLTTSYRLEAETGNMLLLKFVKLSWERHRETGLANEIATIIVHQNTRLALKKRIN